MPYAASLQMDGEENPSEIKSKEDSNMLNENSSDMKSKEDSNILNEDYLNLE